MSVITWLLTESAMILKVDTELKLLLARAGNVRDSISSVRFVLSEYIINSDDVMISSGKEKQLFLFLNRYVYS